jgi:conjugative relaxase-like TrwC/TraI family protein
MRVVRDQGVGYYVDDLVPGRADGDRVAGESPGRWVGRGSAVLGLVGTVGATGFTEVLAGRDPVDGRGLRVAHGGRPVSGFDLTFCAPKSVSVLHLLAPAELGEAAVTAHRDAVADAVDYVERHGLGVRRQRSGEVHHLDTTWAVAAGFDHRTSRALDPHLHTHLVAANVAQGVDGTWSSLDSRRLFLHRRATGAVYDASLRHHLTASAGVAWRRSPAGGWDVDGVDPALARILSQRTASIDEYALLAGGRTSEGRRRVAFFADRPAKQRGHALSVLQAGWRGRLAAAGLDTGDLIDVVGRTRMSPVTAAVDADAFAAGIGRLAAHRARVTSRDLVAAISDAAPAGLPGGAAVRAADAVGVALRDRDVDGATGRVPHWDRDVVARLVQDAPETVARALTAPTERVRLRGTGPAPDLGHRGPGGRDLVR